MPLPRDEWFDIGAYHSRQAAKFQQMYEEKRKLIKETLTAPLESHGIDTRAMPPEEMLRRAAAMLVKR